MTAPLRRRTFSPTGGISMTEQSHTASCDINNILAGYKKTGVISHLAQGGTFENMPDAMEYQDAVNLMMDAEATFEALPAEVRKQFGNDPQKLLEFTSDAKNRDAMVQLGMINADPEPPLPTSPPTPPKKAEKQQPEGAE